jgi:FkbM family methyltransferase
VAPEAIAVDCAARDDPMFTEALKSLFRMAGLKISRLPGKDDVPPSVFEHLGIQVIFDVGANDGQFSIQTRQSGYRGKMVSFEPLPEAHARLQAAANSDPQWSVHPRMALGSAEGTTQINISRNSYSSSILPMLSTHSSAAPDSAYIGVVDTEITTLDAVFQQYRSSGEKAFLKIDTQGFETEVLAGATKSLESISGVRLEMSIVPLYESQDLYRYFLDFFESRGFLLWTLEPGFHDRHTGQLLQFDAVFVRKS